MGVNSYVTVQISFLPESERRCTRVAARTFCPEFDHHMEVSCALLIQTSSGETYLAEQLEEASAVFTVWNSDSRKGLVELNMPYLLLSLIYEMLNIQHAKYILFIWPVVLVLVFWYFLYRQCSCFMILKPILYIWGSGFSFVLLEWVISVFIKWKITKYQFKFFDIICQQKQWNLLCICENLDAFHDF